MSDDDTMPGLPMPMAYSRMPIELVARIDEWVVTCGHPGMTRSGAIRYLVERALNEIDRKKK